MSDLKFSCPHCEQHVLCDDSYGGHQIQCPTCQRQITIPLKIKPPRDRQVGSGPESIQAADPPAQAPECTASLGQVAQHQPRKSWISTLLGTGDPKWKVEKLKEQFHQCLKKREYERALRLAVKMCDFIRRHLGENDPALCIALNNLATVHFLKGDHESALPIFQQDLDLRRVLHGEEHSDFISALENLGAVHCHLKQYSEAEPFFRRALDLNRKARKADDPMFLETLNKVGEFFCLNKQRNEAESVLKEAVETGKRFLGDDHQVVANSMTLLADLHFAERNYGDAAPLYARALETRRGGTGELDGMIRLHALQHLFKRLPAAYFEIGKYAQAEPLLTQAVKMAESMPGRSSPVYLAALMNLAAVYLKMGKSAESESLLKQVLDAPKTTGKETRIPVEDIYDFGAVEPVLALLQAQNGRNATATEAKSVQPATATPRCLTRQQINLLWMNREGLEILKASLGNPRVAVFASDDSDAVEEQKDVTPEDIDWAGQVMAIAERAAAASQKSDFGRAIQLYKDALEQAPDCDLYLMSVGCCLANMGQPREGLRYLERAAAINPSNVRIQNNLAGIKQMVE